jgi:molybdenum ABC transporter ATP-binding protein
VFYQINFLTGIVDNMNSVEIKLTYEIEDFHLSIQAQIEQNDRMILFGASGSGKTTILKLILGLIAPDSGNISINNKTIFDSSINYVMPTHERQIGYVPQNYKLFPHLNVNNNITYGIPKKKLSHNLDYINGIINKLDLKHMQERSVLNLSGGEMQRVAIARALAIRPNLLLLDEPFASLDVELHHSLRLLIKQLQEESHIPMIIVTHDHEEAISLGTKLHVLHEGKFIESGIPIEILGQPQKIATADLLGVENTITSTVLSVDNANGIMLCGNQDLQLEVPLYDVVISDKVVVGIRSSDVIIATEPPVHISARNIIKARIKSINTQASGIELVCEIGSTEIRSKITLSSLEDLQLTVNQEIHVFFKASSCFIISN